MSQQEEDPSHYTRTLVVKTALSQMYDQLAWLRFATHVTNLNFDRFKNGAPPKGVVDGLRSCRRANLGEEPKLFSVNLTPNESKTTTLWSHRVSLKEQRKGEVVEQRCCFPRQMCRRTSRHDNDRHLQGVEKRVFFIACPVPNLRHCQGNRVAWQ